MKIVIARHSGQPGVVDEAKISNRVIRAFPEGWEYECDQRHIEIILEELQLVGCKPLGTPGFEEVLKRTPDEDAYGSEPLEPEIATRYRALTARASYMAQDLAELQFAIKESCRTMSAPTNDSWGKLKRLARYLSGRPRAVSKYYCQQATDMVDVYSDASWAVCKFSHKSTSGGQYRVGAVASKRTATPKAPSLRARPSLR